MRYALPLLALLLAACSESPNMTEFNNLSAQTIADRARIAELTRQLGTPTTDPMVASLAEQVAALKAENAALAAKVAMLGTGKQMHRVGPFGEDLGLGCPGSGSVFLPDEKIEYVLGSRARYLWSSSDCTGPAQQGAGDLYVVGPDQELLKFVPDSRKDFAFASSSRVPSPTAKECSSTGGAKFNDSVAEYQSTGIKVYDYRATDSHLEMR